MLGKCTTPKSNQVIDCDTCADNTQVLVLDRMHVTKFSLKSPTIPVSIYEHEIATPTKVRALKYERDGSLCVLPDKQVDSQGNCALRVVNLTHGYVILKLHHADHPINQILSLSQDMGLITGSINCVRFWKCSFPKNMKPPSTLIPPEIELDLSESSIKGMTEYFLNMDRIEADFSLTRLTYSTDKHFFYRSQFYTLDRVSEGYTHAIDFRTESLVDKCTVSGDGAFFLLHTAKKIILLVSTEDGESVGLVLMQLTSIFFDTLARGIYECAVPSLDGKTILLLDTSLTFSNFELASESQKKKVAFEGVVPRLANSKYFLQPIDDGHCLLAFDHQLAFLITS